MSQPARLRLAPIPDFTQADCTQESIQRYARAGCPKYALQIQRAMATMDAAVVQHGSKHPGPNEGG